MPHIVCLKGKVTSVEKVIAALKWWVRSSDSLGFEITGAWREGMTANRLCLMILRAASPWTTPLTHQLVALVATKIWKQ